MRWGTMTTKAKATLVVAIAAVVWVGGVGSAGALVGAAVSNSSTAHPSATAEAQRFVQTPAPSRTATPTPSPTPTPETVVTEVSERTDVPFARTTVEDAAMPKGESRITTVGVVGAKTTTYRVTTVDGVETKREQVREALNRAPVTEVTAVGTYVAPAPTAAPAPAPQAPAQEAPSTQQGLITPGAFCADAQSGAIAQAANGRSYQCGGKGPDANGHLHWNTM